MFAIMFIFQGDLFKNVFLRVIFPIMFSTFHLMYWTIYLSIGKIVNGKSNFIIFLSSAGDELPQDIVYLHGPPPGH